MSEAKVKIMLENSGYDPGVLERILFDAKIDVEPVDGGYKHTFTMPSQSIVPTSLSCSLEPTEYGMKHFIPALYSQIVADAIIRDLREAFPPHMWQSYFAHKRAVRRAKLRRRRNIRAMQRRRRRGLA